MFSLKANWRYTFVSGHCFSPSPLAILLTFIAFMAFIASTPWFRKKPRVSKGFRVLVKGWVFVSNPFVLAVWYGDEFHANHGKGALERKPLNSTWLECGKCKATCRSWYHEDESTLRWTQDLFLMSKRPYRNGDGLCHVLKSLVRRLFQQRLTSTTTAYTIYFRPGEMIWIWNRLQVSVAIGRQKDSSCISCTKVSSCISCKYWNSHFGQSDYHCCFCFN